MRGKNVNEEFALEADKKRPYKMYAAMLSAFLTSIVASGLELPAWATAILVAIIAALAVYLMPNPLKVKRGSFYEENEPRLF